MGGCVSWLLHARCTLHSHLFRGPPLCLAQACKILIDKEVMASMGPEKAMSLPSALLAKLDEVRRVLFGGVVCAGRASGFNDLSGWLYASAECMLSSQNAPACIPVDGQVMTQGLGGALTCPAALASTACRRQACWRHYGIQTSCPSWASARRLPAL